MGKDQKCDLEHMLASLKIDQMLEKRADTDKNMEGEKRKVKKEKISKNKMEEQNTKKEDDEEEEDMNEVGLVPRGVMSKKKNKKPYSKLPQANDRSGGMRHNVISNIIPSMVENFYDSSEENTHEHNNTNAAPTNGVVLNYLMGDVADPINWQAFDGELSFGLDGIPASHLTSDHAQGFNTIPLQPVNNLFGNQDFVKSESNIKSLYSVPQHMYNIPQQNLSNTLNVTNNIFNETNNNTDQAEYNKQHYTTLLKLNVTTQKPYTYQPCTPQQPTTLQLHSTSPQSTFFQSTNTSPQLTFSQSTNTSPLTQSDENSLFSFTTSPQPVTSDSSDDFKSFPSDLNNLDDLFFYPLDDCQDNNSECLKKYLSFIEPYQLPEPIEENNALHRKQAFLTSEQVYMIFPNHKSLVMIAMAKGKKAWVKVLLHRAERDGKLQEVVNHQDADGRTPLLYAVYLKDLQLIQLLLSKGADVNVKVTNNHVTSSLLGYVVEMGGALDLLVLLLRQEGVKLDVADSIGRTALGRSISTSQIQVILHLIVRGASINKLSQQEQLHLDKLINKNPCLSLASQIITPSLDKQ